jgi:glycosyltransferase involved in cell wall biosynthesis
MRLSIITVNLNNKAGLEHTLRSVVEQTNRDFESIVVDGLSNDGSRDVIAAYEGRVSKWVSEKDSGIFNGMNKGIRMAEGEYLLFLNSGDYLYSRDTLNQVFKHRFSEDFIVFDIELVKKEGREFHSLNKDPRAIIISGPIFHQAVFHRSSVFQKLGMYDETFKMAADYQLFLKAFFTAGCSYRIIHEVLSVYDNICGLSSNISHAELLHNERRKAQRTVFIPEVVDALEEQYMEIQSLSEIKSKYDGLMQSNTVRWALRASAALRRIRRLLGRKRPNGRSG